MEQRLLSETTDVRAIEVLAGLLEDRGCSERTIRQYVQIAINFQAVEVETARTAAPNQDQIELVRKAIRTWEEREVDPGFAKSTVGVYKTAIDGYFEAKGTPIVASSFMTKDGLPAQTSEALTDRQLQIVRRRTAKRSELRVAIELAIAGIPASLIKDVKRADLELDGYPLKVATRREGERTWQILDPQARAWFRKQDRVKLPSDRAVSGRRIAREIGEMLEGLPGPASSGTAIRRLRETGIRRAIQYGIPPKRIAESLGCAIKASWLRYPVMASKSRELWETIDRSMPALDPIDPQLSVDEIMELTDAEYDEFLDKVAGSEKEN